MHLLVIQKVDIFGQPINLNMNQQTKYQSFWGGLFSIILTSTMLVYTINEINGYINARTISIIQKVRKNDIQSIYQNEPEGILLTNNFTFMLQLGNISDPMYDVVIKSTDDTFNIQRCKESNITGINPQEWLCIDNQSITLNSSIGNPNFSNLQIIVKKCVGHSQWGETCNSKVSDANISIITSNNLINPSNNGLFTQSYLDQSFNYQVQKLKFEYSFTLNKVFDYEAQIKVNGLIDPQKIALIQTNTHRVHPNPLQIDSIMEIDFVMNHVQKQFIREYETITDLLSRLGGLFQSVFGVTAIIIRYYNCQKCKKSVYLVYFELSNKLYDFSFDNNTVQDTREIQYDPDPPHKKKKSKKKQAEESEKATHKKSKHKEVDEDSLVKDPYLKIKVDKIIEEHQNVSQQYKFKTRKHFLLTMFQNIIVNKEKIQLSAKYILYKLFFCKATSQSDPKLFLAQKAISRVQKELDIFSILERLSQIEKMKKIIFDYDQQVLFNYSPRIVVSLKDENQATDFVHYQRSFLNIKKKRQSLVQLADDLNKQLKQNYRNRRMLDLEHIYNSYKQVTENNRQSTRFYYKINNKLKDYLGDTLKAIFKASKLIKFQEDLDAQIISGTIDINQKVRSQRSEIGLEEPANLAKQFEIVPHNQGSEQIFGYDL